MKARKAFTVRLKSSRKGQRMPARSKRRIRRLTPAKPTVSAEIVGRALVATPGAWKLIRRYPQLARARQWSPVAMFSPCLKSGTATFLDIWDADHFDGYTDMQRCLTDCRVWFSADGFTFWDSPETKTGRINCYFRAPSSGQYVCNVQLESDGGAAEVECIIDSSPFGPLPFTGSINQPHPCNLNAGYHSFRIRQRSGAFFFYSLTVWKT